MKSLLGKLGVILVAFVLAGCASKVQWTKPGFNPDEYKQDSYLCDREANILASQQAGAMSSAVNPLLIYAITKKKFFNNCMEAKGYQQFKSDKDRELIESLEKPSSAKVYGADWKFYMEGEKISFFYDAQSITRPSQNIVRVWVKYNYTKEGVMDKVGKFGKKYENLSYSIGLWEINCIEKMHHPLSFADYNNKGEVIFSSHTPGQFEFIIPGSMGDHLYKEVCKGGTDWKYYTESEDGKYFYDVESITRPSKNIVRVWSKAIHSEESIKKFITEQGEKYINLAFSKFLIEYDCKEGRMRILMATSYDKNGTIIGEFGSGEYYFVRPQTIEEVLYKAVCK